MFDNNASTPMYTQLADYLANEIALGRYRSGDKLPSENTLCKQFNVSRITVRQALQLMTQQDLIFSVHGKGSFVKVPSINNELNKIVSFSRVLEQKGLNGHTRVYGFTDSSTDKKYSLLFSESVVNLDLLGYIDESPVVYYKSYFPKKLGIEMYCAANEISATQKPFSSYDLYEKIGIKLSRVEQTIRAVNADQNLADILRIKTGDALIVLESVYYSMDNTPLEHKTGYYRSDIYNFHVQRNIQ